MLHYTAYIFVDSSALSLKIGCDRYMMNNCWYLMRRNIINGNLPGEVLILVIYFYESLVTRFNPDIYLKRPAVEGHKWKVDELLKRKAVSIS